MCLLRVNNPHPPVLTLQLKCFLNVMLCRRWMGAVEEGGEQQHLGRQLCFSYTNSLLLVTANKKTYTPLCRKICIPQQMQTETLDLMASRLRWNRRGPVSDAGDELKHMQQILQSMCTLTVHWTKRRGKTWRRKKKKKSLLLTQHYFCESVRK